MLARLRLRFMGWWLNWQADRRVKRVARKMHRKRRAF